jgi:S1-C subfamily serine protease
VALQPLTRVGAYALLECVADTRTATIYRARREGANEAVCLRLYDNDVILSYEQAETLHLRFDELRELPADRFVHTLDFGRDDSTGCWYRVTPWLPNVKAWGDFKSKALLGNAESKRLWISVCLDLAESFQELHRRGRVIPDFTLDDCLLYRTDERVLRVRLDATLAACLGPGSGREKVRDRHPDFASGHTLSAQSDVWTLGNIFVSMVLGTTDVSDPGQAMDGINAPRRPMAVHPKFGRLLRQMVDADPAERPRDMKAVCETLRAFSASDITEWNALERDPWRHSLLVRRAAVAIVLAAATVCAITAALIRRQSRHADAEVARVRAESSSAVSDVRRLVQDGKGYVDAQAQNTVQKLLEQIHQANPEGRAQAVLERYGRSVAFVLTEAWVEVAGRRISLATASGTAFLVSADGYLLSNRHVVAPWLNGATAEFVESQLALLRKSGKPFRFGASHWLWFDGEEAFRNRFAAPKADIQVADIYRLDTAYADSGVKPKLRVVGVMPKPADPAEFLASTLEDDVAVLKVDAPPVGAVPIPLSAGTPPRGTGLLALGYSQGRGAIPGTRALARASRGSASGLIGDVLTTDADIQPGNSGGPVLDLDGYAIGIASALFSSGTSVETSMGRVLPIDTARRFLESARTGRPMWDGLLEAAFEPELIAAQKAAERGDWENARALATAKGVSANPDMSLKAAVYSLDKAGFTAEGRAALERVMAMSPEFPFAALLLYWDAWRRGVPVTERPCRLELLEAEWWSPFEPYGYVARLLDGTVDIDQVLVGAESAMELTLYHWAAGSVAARGGNRDRAGEQLRAGLVACPSDDTLTRDLLAASLWLACNERPRIITGNLSTNTPPRFGPLEESFDALVEGNWKKAASAIDRHFATPRRESANTLGLKLFRCQLKGLAGDAAGERQALQRYRLEIRNAWYRRIADCLLGDADPKAVLASVAGKRPETITLAVALGLQSESLKDTVRAINYYRAALDTGQQNWMEYRFAQARREALGKRGETPR